MNLLALRSRMPLLLALLLVLLFLAVGPLLGYFTYKGSPHASTGCLTQQPADVQAREHLDTAMRMERDGDLEKAAADYRAVLTSPNACQREEAVAGLQRIWNMQEKLGPLHRLVFGMAATSAYMQASLASLLLLLVVCWAAAKMFPRAGTSIADFPVFGTSEEQASRLFRDALLRFANDIKRVYGSQYAQSIGMTLLFDDLKGQELQTSTYDEALAEAKDPDAKAAVRFALTHVIRFLRDAGLRPRLLVQGDVRLFPGDAKAVAVLKDLKTGEESRIEAFTHELKQLPAAHVVQTQLLAPWTVGRGSHAEDRIRSISAGDEERRTSAELYTLALILACKIRFQQLQSLQAGFKPHSWQTVCLFAAGALTLE